MRLHLIRYIAVTRYLFAVLQGKYKVVSFLQTRTELPVRFPHQASCSVPSYCAKLFLVGTEPRSDKIAGDRSHIMSDALLPLKGMDRQIATRSKTSASERSGELIIKLKRYTFQRSELPVLHQKKDHMRDP